MPLNNSGMLLLGLLLAGCGGGGGYEEAPFIGTPPTEGQAGTPGAMAPQYDPPRATVPVSTLDQEPPPADLPQGAGPRGTSGQERYDAVGYAGSFDGGSGQYATASVGVAHPSLPIGSYVELTALDTGRTIVALVAARGAGNRIVDLSPGAAQQLGVGEGAAVRVRLVAPSPQDQMALRSGRGATARMDAPQTLLTALRRKLPGRAEPANVRPTPVRPVPVRPARTVPPPASRHAPPTVEMGPERAAPIRSGYVVQVAAFSTRERAQGVARQVGGRVVPAGRLFRVQVGPFANAASAQRTRDDVARYGYGDARILHIE
jgi:rare lipoprotein A